MHWTTRATSSTGGQATCRSTAGGGVAILWARRLRLQKPRLELPDVGGEEEMTKLKGHLLSLRFDPPAAGSVPRRRMPLIDRTLIVIGAYIPPAAGDWATFSAATTMKGLRLLLERALPVRRYRGAFVLVAGHFNARTGDGPVELKFAQDGFMTERIADECAAARAKSAGAHQVARVELRGGKNQFEVGVANGCWWGCLNCKRKYCLGKTERYTEYRTRKVYSGSLKIQAR
jgi:hypothetical protein